MRHIITAILTALVLGACEGQRAGAGSQDNDTTTQQREAPHTLTLLFAGDMMQHSPQYNRALRAGGGKRYDYTEVFQYVTDEISKADIAVANFEATTAGGKPTSYPRFNAPDDFLTACRDAGFDILLTANNHCCDTGAEGLKRTIEMCDANNTPHVGTYTSQEERDKKYPYLIEHNGLCVALLCYTYGTNGLHAGRGQIVNLIDTATIHRDIMRARAKQPDCIIAAMHWGIEYAFTPCKEQRELAAWLLSNGVDHIIGSHPHVVQPVEVRQGTDGRKHLVAYSLGNYISNMNKDGNDTGMMLRMTLTKYGNAPGAELTDCRYALTWVSRPAVSGRSNYRIYPASVPDSLLNASERQRLHSQLALDRKVLNKGNKGISEYEIAFGGAKL